MSTTGTEKHCRLCLMLTKGGTKACHYLLLKRVQELSPEEHQPYPWTVQQFLQRKKETIEKSKILKDNFNVLFPPTGDTDLSKWDLSLYCNVLIFYCQLPLIIKQDVELLKKLRNDLCHINDPNITDPEFKDKGEAIKVIIGRILDTIDVPDVKIEIETVMNSLETESLSLGESLKEMHRFYRMEMDIREKLDNVEETVLERLKLLDDIKELIIKKNDQSESSEVNSVRNNLLVPEVGIYIDLKNVSEEEEENMSVVLQKLFEEVINEDVGFKSSIPDDSYVSLRKAVKKTFQLFLSKGWEIITVRHRCILLHIRCSNFESLAALFREQIHGHINEHLIYLNQALNDCVHGKEAYLETTIYKDEFWNVLDKSISQVEEFCTELDFKSCNNERVESIKHSLSLTTKNIQTEANQSFEIDCQHEIETVLQLLKTDLEIHGSEISIQTKCTPKVNSNTVDSMSKDEEGLQVRGDPIPITTPLLSSVKDHAQVENNDGGYVFKLDNFKRLQRFLIMGSQDGSFFEKAKMLTRQNLSCLDGIISDGKGVQAVQEITKVSIKRRNMKQFPVLLAYTVCAKSNDINTKKAAYAAISEVCRLPTHLFKFIKLSALEDVEFEGKGWGRAHKRGISKWYTNFANQPEKLARLVSKFKIVESWSHKDVIRLAHVSTQDKPVGFIIRYILKGLEKAREMYIDSANDTDQDFEQLKRLEELLTTFEKASRCENEQDLCSMIREYQLTWEQCNSAMLKSKSVWKALLPHMPIEAAVRNLGRMTQYLLFSQNSDDENIILKKIQSIGTLNETPVEGTRFAAANKETEGAVATVQEGNGQARRKNVLHPFKILKAIIFYKSGGGGSGSFRWFPNEKIITALDTAFYQAFESVEPSGKKFYLGVDVSVSMSYDVLEMHGFKCSTAAAAMMMVTARIEEKCIIKGFNRDIISTGINSTDSLAEVVKKINVLPQGASDCTRPIYDAMENKIKDIDVFVVYTANETNFGLCHPCEAIRDYRCYSERPRAKLVVVGMCATEFTIADQEDPYMIDVVGFDPATPRLISEFAMDKV